MKTVKYTGNIKNKSEGIYREENGKIILGQALNIYIHNLRYYLTELKIYADGVIDCWGLVTFEEFKNKVHSGWVATELPDTADVSISPSFGDFTATNTTNLVKPEELIKEVADIIDELNGRLTTSDICQKAFEEYQKKPNETNRHELQEAYEAIPEHNRIYVLEDMNQKDDPIKSVIYGKQDLLFNNQTAPLKSQKICFIHHSNQCKKYPLSQSGNEVVFYWYTDRYFDLITRTFSSYKYLYFFFKDYYEDKFELNFRGDEFPEAHKRYLAFKKWAENRENSNNGYREPPILSSHKKIDPDLIAEYDEEKKDFFVVSPDKYKGIKLELFNPNGYSKNFLLTRLPELFPEIKETIL